MSNLRLNLFASATLGFLVFYAGCQYAGLTSVAGTPTIYERVVQAEYNLTERANDRLLVYVVHPARLNTAYNLRYHMTRSFNKMIIQRLEMPEKALVDYAQLVQLRSSRHDFQHLSIPQTGKSLGADMVLVVKITDYRLKKVADTGYEGAMSASALLIDTKTGEKIWPQKQELKAVKVGFDMEPRGREVAVVRLIAACTHCITRYLYDCPARRFKIADERSRKGWKDWDKQIFMENQND